RITAASPLVRHQVEQEVRKRKAGERAVVRDEAEQSVVAGIKALLVVAQELAAELEGVPAFQPGRLFVDLIRLRQRIGVGRDRSRQREAAAPPDLAET